jgi:D-3-phosphoglycerate dehydrogenase
MRVLVSDSISERGIQILQEGGVEVVVKTGLNQEELISIIGEFDGLVVRSQTKVTSDIIEAAKNLKVIGRAGVGVDNVDVPAATKQGIIVLNAPEGNTITTAEHTIAMMMALARNIPQAYIKLKSERKWDRKSFMGVEANGKTLGVVGLGRIGAEVAKRAQGMNMRVVAYDPYISEEKARELRIELASLEDVIKQADFITVHTPLTKDTRHMIDTKEFEMMKPGVRIINCARGGIISEAALVEGLRSGKVAGAALDVFEEEPPLDSPLLEFPNVIAVPHLGASTEEAQINVAIDVAEQVVNVLNDRPFKNAVNLPFLRPEVLSVIEPYFTLVLNLGKLIAQISKGRMKKVKITYSGELADTEVGGLTAIIVQGVLEPILHEKINIVNALPVAQNRGLEIVEIKTSQSHQFSGPVAVELETDAGVRSASGALINKMPKIVEIDGYFVDAVPSGHMLIVSHMDRPGLIGAVGTILGNNNINIASMQVGRKAPAGDAVMILAIEGAVGEDVLEAIKGVSGLYDVSSVDL